MADSRPMQLTTVVRRRLAATAMVVLALAALAVAALPFWIMWPFTPQKRSGLALAYALRTRGPIATTLGLALAGGLALWLWRGARPWRKAAIVLALVPTAFGAWLSRANPFEWAFTPLRDVVRVPAGEASFIAGPEMVLAVSMGGESVAYPVRQVAYHHVVQDVVGGSSIVATY